MDIEPTDEAPGTPSRAASNKRTDGVTNEATALRLGANKKKPSTFKCPAFLEPAIGLEPKTC